MLAHAVEYRCHPDYQFCRELTYVGRIMNFAQVSGVVRCAVVVVAVVACGKDRSESLSDAVGPVTATAGSPGARNDVVATAMSTPVAIDLVANDADPGSVVTGVTQGTHGRVVLAGARATYTPAPGWQG